MRGDRIGGGDYLGESVGGKAHVTIISGKVGGLGLIW